MLHRTFSQRGGRAKSPEKTEANRAKIATFWTAVRKGERSAPHYVRKPPEAAEVARRLAPYCDELGIMRLEVFGSVARGDAHRGSDVDLIATFQENPGLRIVEIEEAMSKLLRVPVDLVAREAVDEMTNPFRRESINNDRRVIYGA